MRQNQKLHGGEREMDALKCVCMNLLLLLLLVWWVSCFLVGFFFALFFCCGVFFLKDC